MEKYTKLTIELKQTFSWDRFTRKNKEWFDKLKTNRMDELDEVTEEITLKYDEFKDSFANKEVYFKQYYLSSWKQQAIENR